MYLSVRNLELNQRVKENVNHRWGFGAPNEVLSQLYIMNPLVLLMPFLALSLLWCFWNSVCCFPLECRTLVPAWILRIGIMRSYVFLCQPFTIWFFLQHNLKKKDSEIMSKGPMGKCAQTSTKTSYNLSHTALFVSFCFFIILFVLP